MSHLVFCRRLSIKESTYQHNGAQETQAQSLGWEYLCRRKWPPTPLFLPEKSYGWRPGEGLQSITAQRVGHNLANVSRSRLENQDLYWDCEQSINISVTFWNTSSSLYLLWWFAHKTHTKVNIYWVLSMSLWRLHFRILFILQMILLGL